MEMLALPTEELLKAQEEEEKAKEEENTYRTRYSKRR